MENNDPNIQKFGYSEMYEWANEINFNDRIGRFVTFANKDKIRFAHDDDYILGITTVCAVDTSDDPDNWKYAYICNEFGDYYLKKEKLAVGAKIYDQKLEMNYIKTYPWEHFIKIESQYFDPNKEYIKRSNRGEWIRVNLLGKVIVKDNGKCVPGEFCTVYSGKIKENWGIAVPFDPKNSINSKFYVLDRLTDNTILIINK